MPMITRYRIETSDGLYLTDCDEFTHEVDDAVQFRSETEACEHADLHEGAMVEKFQRYSAYGDIDVCVSVSVETLQKLRSCIIGFEDDKASNLLPTDASLARARDLIRSTLNAPRKFEPAHLASAE